MIPMRVFLGWEQPVVQLVAERLLRLAQNQGGGVPPDLSHLLVVVPTQQSGRRLRERLAAAPGGVFSPRVVTPDSLFQPADSAKRLTETQALLLAADRLGRLSARAFSHLFPKPPSRDWTWRLGTAAHWFKLRRLLSDAGLTLADAAAVLTEQEPERWQELAELEKLYMDDLRAAGCEDRIFAQLDQARTPRLPDGVATLVLAATPDPTPLALLALEKLADAGLDVQIWIHAPDDLAELFDAWGRPLAAPWGERRLAMEDSRIRLAMKPEHQADELMKTLPPNLNPSQAAALLALGVLDPEVVPHLETALERRGISTFDPVETPLLRHPLIRLATDLLELANDDAFTTFSRLLRHPDALAALRQLDGILDPCPLLTGLDQLQNEHLATTFSDVRLHAAANHGQGANLVALAAARVESWIAPLRAPDWPERLPELLADLYGQRDLNPQLPSDKLFADAATQLAELLAQLRVEVVRARISDPAVLRRALIQALGSAGLTPEPDVAAVSFDGWLELHWNDAPHLRVCGFNESFVPGCVTRHLFLPDAARKTLAMPDAAQRFARDFYLLEAMVSSRHHSGDVVLVLGKSTAGGDVHKPSRLLFRCPPEALPARARRLFGHPPAASIVHAVAGWSLRPRLAPPPAVLSITQFRDYLECPFRFYLKHVLKMTELDDRAQELDALAFGNAAHHVMEQFARDRKLRDSTDADVIARFFDGELAHWFNARFGRTVSAALVVQKEMLQQRLRHAARIQAEQRQAGWRILPEWIEQRVEKELVAGLTVRGRIDRVERHEDSGVIRVLDFKTTDAPKSPRDTHFAAARNATPEHARFQILDAKGKVKERRWIDLQLPLYAWILRGDSRLETGAAIKAAYFNLPKAVLDTAVKEFVELDAAAQTAAETCARTVATLIRDGQFWPPEDKVSYEVFERLCPAGEWCERFVAPTFPDGSHRSSF